MKIIYLTDIHDGLTGLKKILLQTSADLYLFSGDIIYKAFFSQDRIIDFCTFQDDLYNMAKDNGEDINPYDLAMRIIRFPKKYPESILEMASIYRNLFHQAAKTMKEKYTLIEDMLQTYAKVPVHFLPGNYDIDLQYTSLYERDLHRKSMEFGNLKFSGYGGAPIITSGIPEKLAVKFHEYAKNGVQYSEPEDFFRTERPDVMLVHNPAYGFLDKIPSYGHVGSHGLRRYLDDNNPILVLSGHVHEDQGIIKRNNTVFLNPSNFGPVDSVYGFQEGGFFSEIYIDNNQVGKVGLFRLENNSVRKLLEIDSTDNLQLVYADKNPPVSAEEFVRS